MFLSALPVIVMFGALNGGIIIFRWPLSVCPLLTMSHMSHLYAAPGAGAPGDEVPQVGREDALQDPLLVLPRRPARTVAAHHAAR